MFLVSTLLRNIDATIRAPSIEIFPSTLVSHGTVFRKKFISVFFKIKFALFLAEFCFFVEAK